MQRWLRVSLVWLSVWLMAARASAEACPNGVSDDEARTRLAFIERHFDDAAWKARIWWAVWLAASAGEGIASAVEYPQTKNKLDKDLYLTTWVSSIVYVGELVIFPMVPAYAGHRMRKYPRNTLAERCQALEKATKLLEHSADFEAEGVSVLTHLLGLGWALGVAGFMLGRNIHWDKSLRTAHNKHVLWETGIDFLFTEITTEIAIWTQPTSSIAAFDELKRRECERTGKCKGPAKPRTSLSMSAGLGSFALRLSF